MGLPCQHCKHKKKVPYNTHIGCANVDLLTGRYIRDINGRANPHGVKHGWFYWPVLFDPIWGPDDCPGFTEREDANGK